MKTTALNFVKNTNGLIINQLDVLTKLQALIEDPCEESWDNAFNIIISDCEKPLSLWQAVAFFDKDLQETKSFEHPWDTIPTRHNIIQALNYAVFEHKVEN